jgi:murein DD-endopeptidase MepM/ murein hydrolase activator NlpD
MTLRRVLCLASLFVAGFALQVPLCAQIPTVPETFARSKLDSSATAGSKGGLHLVTFRKTDGVMAQQSGVHYYNMYFEADVDVLRNLSWCHVGDDFTIGVSKEEALRLRTGSGCVLGDDYATYLQRGQRVHLQGQLRFLQMESGWRLEHQDFDISGAPTPAPLAPATTPLPGAAPAISVSGARPGITLLTHVIPGGQLGTFRHGTKVTGCYSATRLIDIQPRGVSFAQKCTRTRLLVHAGVDIVAPRGTEVRPLANGTVTDVVATATDLSFQSLGYAVLLQHTMPSNNKPTWSLYLHLDQPPAVDPGDQVNAGRTVLGYVGQTGAAFGPHTHLEVRHFPERVSPKWRNVYGVEAPAPQGGTFDPAHFAEDWDDPAPLLQAAASLEGMAGAVDEASSSTTIAGSYSLQSVNGQPLPYAFAKTGANTNEWVGDILTIANDGTYIQVSTVRSTRSSTSIKKDSGTWTRNDTRITFRSTSNSSQPLATGTFSGGVVTLLSRGYTLIYGQVASTP